MIKIKGRQNSKISSLFRSSWNTDNSSGKRGRGFPKLIHNCPMGTKIVIVPLKDYVLSYQCLYLTICERLTTLKTISEMYYGIFIIIIT